MKTKPEKSKKHKEEFDEIEEQTEDLASENPEGKNRLQKRYCR